MSKAIRPIALVTGGSRGLGATIVRHLHDEGYVVAYTSRTPGEGLSTRGEERGKPGDHQNLSMCDGGAPRRFVMDLRNKQSMRTAVQRVSGSVGVPDVLVNNGAILSQGLFLTQRPDEMTEMVDINMNGTMYLTQLVAKLMTTKGRGSIVNISSVSAIRGYRGTAAYGATKAAIDALAPALARELGSFNIRVNTITPGYFDSDLSAGVTDRNRERILARTPLGRFATTRDLAEATVFLAGEKASFITGQTIIIDGGITC